MSRNAANYGAGNTFAMPAHVYCLWDGLASPPVPTAAVGPDVEGRGPPGIQLPSWPVVRRVSNIPRTLRTRSPNPGSPAVSSATRSSEWITVE